MTDNREVRIETVERLASEHGWMRRPELDTAAIDAWEKPDGTLYAARKGVPPSIVTLLTPLPPQYRAN